MPKRRADKSSAKTSVVRVKQPHGGELQRGNPGNRGGPGVVPSVIREHLRGSFEERIPLIEQIADGHPIQHMSIPLSAVLGLAKCPTCGDNLVAASDEVAKDAGLINISAKVSASPKDRLAALDLAAKYGLGALKEISIENVRERVQGTLSIIRSHVPPELYQSMLPELRSQWA